MKMRIAMVFVMVAMTLLCGTALKAQKTKAAPPAPVPTQIVAAKKVFIANAGGNFDSDIWSGGPARAYNEFYASMKSWGRYELVGAPADADLVMELSFTATMSVPVYVASFGNDHPGVLEFRLRLVDPKTQICLWGLNKGMPLAILKENRDKDFDQLLARLADDLKEVTTPATAAAAK